MANTLDAPQDIDPRTFWSAIGCRAAGVAIVTVEGAEGPAGFLALSATHLTASPPTVTVSLDRKTSAATDLLQRKAFAINYLCTGGGEIFARFSAKDGPKGAARFEGLELSRLATGAPILPHITGVLDCQLAEVIELYGTYLLIGRIVAFENNKDRQPLVHYQGRILA